MLRAFAADEGGRLRAEPAPPLAEAVWIDLLRPTPAEMEAAAAAAGIALPTREAMEEIEPSSRLYHEGGAAYMTAILPAGADGDQPAMAPVGFVLTPRQLVTLRFHEPRPFTTFPGRAQQAPVACTDGRGALLGLLDDIVDRLADILERAGRDLDALSDAIFATSDAPEGTTGDHQRALKAIGRMGRFLSKIRDSLGSLQRLMGFLDQRIAQGEADAPARGLIETLSRDVQALEQQAEFHAQTVTLLLDATLGLINIEQSNIIKTFSVVAFVLLPPTLIASIYGMNFERMPELGWRLGYPLALAAMVVSAILPYLYFKRRGWL